jgi:hypothetical protein
VNIRALLSVAVAVSALIPAPSLAKVSAIPGASPVAIVQSTVQGGSVSSSLNTPGEVDVTFVNHRAVPATHVSFALVSNGVRRGNLEAAGTFSPGVSIEKTFQLQSGGRDLQVVVASVLFADGSRWKNKSVPAQVKAAR